jgi:hypothetical protein
VTTYAGIDATVGNAGGVPSSGPSGGSSAISTATRAILLGIGEVYAMPALSSAPFPDPILLFDVPPGAKILEPPARTQPS